MTGTVTEESGAVVPDARIELADITTGTTYSSVKQRSRYSCFQTLPNRGLERNDPAASVA